MYSGFIGTVLSHFVSLFSSLWAIFSVRSCRFISHELYCVWFGFFLVAANSSLALVRYGSSEGYKLRRLHIVLLNISAILNFTIIEITSLIIIKSSWILFCVPILNFFPLLTNAFAKDYKTKYKPTDLCIAINGLFFLLVSFFIENYNGVALSLSFLFGYFVIGESGFFLDSEVPSVDAFQYLTCFLNYFATQTLCN